MIDPPGAAAAPAIDPEAIDAAVQLLATAAKTIDHVRRRCSARRAGGRALAEPTAPVTAFRSGRGIVPEDHPLGVAGVAARELWDDVDVLVGIGSRLEMPYLRWRNPMRYDAGRARTETDSHRHRSRGDGAVQPDVAIVADSARRAGCSPSDCNRRPSRIATASPKSPRPSGRPTPRSSASSRRRRICERFEPCCRATAILVPELSQVGLRDLHGRVSGAGAAHLYLAKVFKAHSVSVSRRRSASKWPIRTRPSCPSRETAGSCSACRSSRRPRNTGSRS